MSISTAPVPPAPAKKRGMGCCGCGCAIVALILVLVLAVVGGLLYMGYKTTYDLTTATPPAIPAFSGTEDVYQGAVRKLADFNHDVKNHQAATVQLSADEINSLIAHSPDVAKYNIHAYVTLTDTEGRVQASVPTDVMSHGLMAGRYLGMDATFEVHFDAETKSVNLIPHALQLGDKVIAGPNAADPQSARTLEHSFAPINQLLNNMIRNSPDAATLLDDAKTIQIENGQLVIETQ